MIGRGKSWLRRSRRRFRFIGLDVQEKVLEKKIEKCATCSKSLPELESALAKLACGVSFGGYASGLVRRERVKRYAQKTLLSALNDFDDYVQSMRVEALKWLQDSVVEMVSENAHVFSLKFRKRGNLGWSKSNRLTSVRRW